jgi:hypothetical protein
MTAYIHKEEWEILSQVGGYVPREKRRTDL